MRPAAAQSMLSGVQMEPTAQVESTAPALTLPSAVDTDATESVAELQNLPLPTVSTDITGNYCVPVQLNVSVFYSVKTSKRNELRLMKLTSLSV